MSNTLVIAGIAFLLVFMGLYGTRGKISKELYRFVIILIPLTHIGIVYSTFVSVSYVVIGMFILQVVLRRLAYGRFAAPRGYEIALMLFIFYIGVTLFWAAEWRETTKYYIGFLLAGSLVLALRQGDLGPSQAITAKHDIIIVGAVLGLLGILQIIFGPQLYPTYENESMARLSLGEIDRLQETSIRSLRGTGTFLNATAYSIFLLTPFCICVDELLRSRKLHYIFLLLLIVGGIISTFARVTYALTILGAICLCSFYLRRGKTLGILIIIAIGLMIVLFLPGKYELTIMNMFTGASEDSLSRNIRYYYWQMATELFWTSPIFGLGYGNVESYGYSAFGGFNPHSSYITILVNQGAIGLGLFVLFLITSFIAFKRVLRSDKYTLRPLFVVFLLYLISLMTDTLIYGDPFVNLMPVVLLGIYTSGLRPTKPYPNVPSRQT